MPDPKFHDHIAAFSELLDDDERDEFGPFADALLEKRGYQKSTQWLEPAPEPSQGRPRLKAPAPKQDDSKGSGSSFRK
jgi:hypothetical protein